MSLSRGNNNSEIDEKILFHLLNELENRPPDSPLQSPSMSSLQSPLQTPNSPSQKQVKLKQKDLVQLISNVLNYWIKTGKIQPTTTFPLSEGIYISGGSKSMSTPVDGNVSTPKTDVYRYNQIYNENLSQSPSNTVHSPSSTLNSENFQEIIIGKNYINPSDSINFNGSNDYTSTDLHLLKLESPSSERENESSPKNDKHKIYNNPSSSFLHSNENDKKVGPHFDLERENYFVFAKDSNKRIHDNRNTINYRKQTNERNSQLLLETLNRSLQSLKKELKKIKNEKEELINKIETTNLSTRRKSHLYHFLLFLMVVVIFTLYFVVVQDLKIQLEQARLGNAIGDIDSRNLCGYY